MKILEEKCKALRYLVTDDYKSMQSIIGDHLKQLGISSISYADSGNDAMEILLSRAGTSDSIEFLITDLVMNEGSGLELIQKVKSNKALQEIPIIVISSQAEMRIVLECVKSGASNYLIKPWKIEDLARKINSSMSF